ncbi:MAG: hypothetical protein GY842_12930 [bacterium]|nr:hypothetical protein [bacterium]
MEQNVVDLCGRICPYPVVEVVREVERLRKGETLRCVIDDPLALKSIPEELEDFPDVSLTIVKHDIGWEVIVARE